MKAVDILYFPGEIQHKPDCAAVSCLHFPRCEFKELVLHDMTVGDNTADLFELIIELVICQEQRALFMTNVILT